LAFPGQFTPVLAKHSKSFSLVDAISIGVDRMQRNFEPMRKQVETWHQIELSDVSAKMIIYQAFIESELEVPKHLARRVHDFYFRNTTNSNRARCGVCRTRSRLRLRTSTRFHSSGRRQSSAASSKPGSSRASEVHRSSNNENGAFGFLHANAARSKHFVGGSCRKLCFKMIDGEGDEASAARGDRELKTGGMDLICRLENRIDINC
jgi:hypothetical protein